MTGLALWLRPSNRVVGLVMGFGAGALISTVAYELAPEAAGGDVPVALGLAVGAVAFFVGDWVIDRRGGAQRKSIGREAPAGAGQAIFVGTLLDGAPESLVLGMSLAQGGSAGRSFLVAVFVSNLPEAMAATSSMRDAGQPRRTILAMWLALVVASGVAAALGFLTMLADTMMPEAFEHGGRTVGLVTVLGFVVAAALTVAGSSPRRRYRRMARAATLDRGSSVTTSSYLNPAGAPDAARSRHRRRRSR